MGHLSSKSVNSPIIGKSAQDVVLMQSDGKTASILASLQGKKTMLVFWATWCPHCYEELGMINDQWALIEKKGIKIILVDVGESKEAVRDYFNRRQMKRISFLDQDNYLQEPYHLIGVPTLIFIDEKGIIRNMTHEFPSDFESYFGV